MMYYRKLAFFIIILSATMLLANITQAQQVGPNFSTNDTVKATADSVKIRNSACSDTGYRVNTGDTMKILNTSTINCTLSGTTYRMWNVQVTSGSSNGRTGYVAGIYLEKAPAPASCPVGNGKYCGSSSVSGQNTNYLYNCSNGSYSLSQSCAYGCQSMPTGQDDVCKSAPTPAPTVSISVNTTSITLGNSFILKWTSTNATACEGYNSQSSGYTYAANNTSGLTITPSSVGTYTTGMRCENSAGTASAWSMQNVAVTAIASCPVGNGKYCGSSSVSGQNTNYLYNCSNGSYSLSQSCAYGCQSMPTGQDDVCKSAPALVPVVSLTPSASSINVGQSATLGWGTSNATSCTGSASPVDSNWSGSITPVGGGSQTVTPAQTTIYTLSCSGSGGNISNSVVTITVNQPGGPVTCTAPGSSTITKKVGETFTINWCAVNVSSWSVSGPGLSPPRNGDGVGGIPEQCGGSICPSLTLSSPGTYTYIISGTGNSGPFSKSMTVEITSVVNPPTCGDSSCNGSETCNSCPRDCGVCSPQCNDGRDNDGDGKIDFPADSGCSSISDDDETDVLPAVINNFWAESSGLPLISGPSVCNIDANPKLLILPKNTSTLTWSCDKVINGCTLRNNNPKVPDIGAVASTSPSSGLETPAIDATTTFTLQCPGADDKSVKVMLFSPFLKEIIPQ